MQGVCRHGRVTAPWKQRIRLALAMVPGLVSQDPPDHHQTPSSCFSSEKYRIVRLFSAVVFFSNLICVVFHTNHVNGNTESVALIVCRGRLTFSVFLSSPGLYFNTFFKNSHQSINQSIYTYFIRMMATLRVFPFRFMSRMLTLPARSILCVIVLCLASSAVAVYQSHVKCFGEWGFPLFNLSISVAKKSCG